MIEMCHFKFSYTEYLDIRERKAQTFDKVFLFFFLMINSGDVNRWQMEAQKKVKLLVFVATLKTT